MRTVVIVQARMGSTRLPGKVLLPVMGTSLLEHQLERIKASREPFDLAVATSREPADQVIFDASRRAGVECLAGHPTDLLDRHLMVALAFRADVVVKIPSDCPLIDPKVIDRVIGRFREHGGSCDYASNLHPATYPDGNDVEIMTLAALEAAHYEARRPFEREHTTPFIWERPERFRLENVELETGQDLSMSHRFTLDYPEDYDFIRAVYERLWSPTEPVFSLPEILRLLHEQPELRRINERYLGVNWYRHHLSELAHVRPSETRTLPDRTAAEGVMTR